jgi:hypothetical protein
VRRAHAAPKPTQDDHERERPVPTRKNKRADYGAAETEHSAVLPRGGTLSKHNDRHPKRLQDASCRIAGATARRVQRCLQEFGLERLAHGARKLRATANEPTATHEDEGSLEARADEELQRECANSNAQLREACPGADPLGCLRLHTRGYCAVAEAPDPVCGRYAQQD